MPTPSYQLKLRRAQDHLHTFLVEVEQWFHANHNPFAIEGDLAGEATIKFNPATEYPIEKLGLILGDALHNERAALDHLAYALAERHTGTPLPDAIAKGSEFLIASLQAPSPGTIQNKIGGIDPAAQAIILAIQPHQLGANYADSPLFKLHELERIDKHRLLHAVPLEHSETVVDGENVQVEELLVEPGKLLKGSVVGKIQLQRAKAADPMHVNTKIDTRIVIEKGLPLGGEPVVSAVRQLFGEIQDTVITPLEAYL